MQFLVVVYLERIGEGTLNSRIPEAHTDYIMSVIAEEFGVIIVISIILIYLIFSYTVLKNWILQIITISNLYWLGV